MQARNFRIAEKTEPHELGIMIRMFIVELEYGENGLGAGDSRNILSSQKIVSQAEIDNCRFDAVELTREEMRLKLVQKFFRES